MLTKVLQRPRLGGLPGAVDALHRLRRADAGRRLPLLPRRRARAGVRGRDGRAVRRLLRGAAARARVGRLDSYPRAEGESEAARARAVNAKALDLLRGLLPAASLSHMGIYATGQAYEQLILHLIGHPLPEARRYGELILAAIKAVMPSFVARVERPDRGGAWAGYLAERRAAGEHWAARLGLDGRRPGRRAAVGDADARRRRRGAAARGAAVRGRGDERGAHARRRGRARRRRARRAAARPRRRAREPPPPAGARLRGAALPLRGRLRLRRVPRPPAPPHADGAVAGAHAGPRRRHPRGGRRRRRGRCVPRGARPLGGGVRAAGRRRPGRRGARTRSASATGSATCST